MSKKCKNLSNVPHVSLFSALSHQGRPKWSQTPGHPLQCHPGLAGGGRLPCVWCTCSAGGLVTDPKGTLTLGPPTALFSLSSSLRFTGEGGCYFEKSVKTIPPPPSGRGGRGPPRPPKNSPTFVLGKMKILVSVLADFPKKQTVWERDFFLPRERGGSDPPLI